MWNLGGGGRRVHNGGAFLCPKLKRIKSNSNTYFKDPSSNMIQTSNILKSDISNLKSKNFSNISCVLSFNSKGCHTISSLIINPHIVVDDNLEELYVGGEYI
jgi:hypothetical protein